MKNVWLTIRLKKMIERIRKELGEDENCISDEAIELCIDETSKYLHDYQSYEENLAFEGAVLMAKYVLAKINCKWITPETVDVMKIARINFENWRHKASI